MRCLILMAFLVAVSKATPFDKSAKPTTLTLALQPNTTASDNVTTDKHLLPQENKNQPLTVQPQALRHLIIEDNPQVSKKPEEKPSTEHKKEGQLLVGNHLNKPEPIPLPAILQSHHVQEHELNVQLNRLPPGQSTPLPEHNKPQEESELSEEINEEIALIQTIGAIAVSLELAILEELKQSHALHDQKHQHEHQHNHGQQDKEHHHGYH